MLFDQYQVANAWIDNILLGIEHDIYRFTSGVKWQTWGRYCDPKFPYSSNKGNLSWFLFLFSNDNVLSVRNMYIPIKKNWSLFANYTGLFKKRKLSVKSLYWMYLAFIVFNSKPFIDSLPSKIKYRYSVHIIVMTYESVIRGGEFRGSGITDLPTDAIVTSPVHGTRFLLTLRPPAIEYTHVSLHFENKSPPTVMVFAHAIFKCSLAFSWNACRLTYKHQFRRGLYYKLKSEKTKSIQSQTLKVDFLEPISFDGMFIS